MASRALAAAARGPEDYVRVYDRILRQVREPVIIHWLGEMFDPALAGYWGSADHWRRWTSASTSSRRTPTRSTASRSRCSSKEKEIAMRRAAAGGRADVYRRRLQLRRADRRRRPTAIRDALLGIFDAIAPAASAALAALGRGPAAPTFHDILAPTVPLSRHIFKAPTRFYKTGVVFLAWLNGHPGPFHDGRRPGERPLAAASGRAVPAGRQARGPAARSRARGRPDAQGRWRCTGSKPDARSDPGRPRASRAQPGDGARAVEPAPRRSKAASATASPAIAPWRDQVQAIGAEAAGTADPGRRPARLGLLPRRHVPGGRSRPACRRRSTTTAARSTRPRRSAPNAW